MDGHGSRVTALRAECLGQLLIMQSVLDSLPDEASIQSFVCRGLSGMPGVRAVGFGDAPGEVTEGECVRFPLLVGDNNKGELVIVCEDLAAFMPYESYVKNFCFMIAVVLEERHQRRLAESYRGDLEERVQQRTSALLKQIAERIRIEESLRQSEARFRTLVENAPDAIVVHTDGKFTYVNRRALEFVGADSPEQLLGQPVLERFPERYREAVQQRQRIVYEERRAAPVVEMQVYRLDGATRDAEIAVVPIVYEGKNGALAFLRDVTDRRRLEEKLREVQRMEAVGQLAGGVAHDFNNILASMMMSLGLLQENKNLDEETLASLRELQRETDRAADLTRQLLQFSRRSVLEIKVLDLNEVVANLLKMLSRLIGENVDLRFERRTVLPLVKGDAGMLEQVLINLSVNARDAMPEGGRITITTEAVDIDEERARANPEMRAGSFVCLSVADTGCGMDEGTLKRAFEPFFTTKDVGKGTGLGLATVHGIVAQHQGWVEVDSCVGQGTKFRVFLPASTESAGPSTESRESEVARSRSSETVLLVEDDQSLRSLITRMLRKLHYQVLEAGNGREAMRLWHSSNQQIDLLITDMVMPAGMTGLELAEVLRAEKPDLKVVVCSGYSTDLAGQSNMRTQGIAYLPKPFSVPALGKIVRECLDQD